MGARRVQGDFKLTQGYVVATGQAVETYDMVAYPQVAPAYNTSVTYYPGQLVSSVGLNYICNGNTTTTGQSGNTPATSSTYWTPLLSNSIIRASDLCNVIGTTTTPLLCTAITTSAPTVAATSVSIGSTLANVAYFVMISYNFPWGEGTLSASGTATPSAAFGLLVSGCNPVWPAISTNVYLSTTNTAATMKLAAVVTGDNVTLNAVGAGRFAPTAVAQTALAVTQYVFAEMFAGCSNQRMPTNGPPAIFGTPTRPFGNSSDNTIMISRGGVYEFDCASATFQQGTYVGAAKATGNLLLTQTVVAVGGPSLAIGKVFKDYTSTTTKVMVEIVGRTREDIANPTGFAF